MTSGYDRPRDGGKRSHGGLDFAAPIGTPVKAPQVSGGLTVREARFANGYGNTVLLSGTDSAGQRVEWRFSHLSEIEPGLKPGAAVMPGSLLGKVGNTGSVIASKGGNGSHLDLKLTVNGKKMDPRRYYEAAGIFAGRGAKPAPAARGSADGQMPLDDIMTMLSEGWD
jgi:murein DD-endopeptidase MepM/ murein hydrolase activator NlpD